MQCENGFKTLDILSEGLWASLTGGWFYDVRQNVFCNTFHLYLWLFLLCFPFVIHLFFPPSPLVSSFYCGTVGITFIILKLVNHRLHKMFDTSEGIQEIIPGEDLPESQKKISSNERCNLAVDYEWVELKELHRDKNTSDVPSNASFQEATDDESINSSEATSRQISNTIDLKADIHHKNFSGSSENISLKPVIEDDAAGLNESEKCGLLNEEKIKANDLIGANFRSKHQLNGNKLRLKNEENVSGIQDVDFAFSLSDCHIAKLKNKSMDDLSEEYKISQSDCQISKFYHNNDKERDILQNNSTVSIGNKKLHIKNKDNSKRKYRKGFSRHLGASTQNEENPMSQEKSESLDIGNLASNGSCDVLILGQSNKEQIKNTGSLELPLRDTENSNFEKGLLYWKQQNLDNNRVDNLREAPNILLRPCNKLHVSSETNIHSADRSPLDNSIKRLNKTMDFVETANQEEKEQKEFHNSNCSRQDTSPNDRNSEKSFLKILEENFDWYSSEYQNEKTDKLNFVKSKIKEVANFKSDENIKGKFEEIPKKSEIKFQVDSDEDSSDNYGLRSPLLCRHESFDKETQEQKTYICSNKRGQKITRTFSNEESKGGHNFNKMVRTLSADEDVVLSRRYKTSEVLPKVERGAFGSVLLSVYDDDDTQNLKETAQSCGFKKKGDRDKTWKSKSCKSFIKKQPSSSVSEKSMTDPVHVSKIKHPDDNDNVECKISKKNEKLSNKDVLSWSNEKVGLEWLFEHTDSENDNQPACHWRYTLSDDSDISYMESKSDTSKNVSAVTSCTSENQGAIPKTRTKMNGDRNNSRSKSHDGRNGKFSSKIKSYPDEFENSELAGQIQRDMIRKQKNERENGIIDEEDIATLQKDSLSKENRDKEGDKRSRKNSQSARENYDSSNNANFELSSLLPLSSLLSSLNPPTSPLLAAFLATRKDTPNTSQNSNLDYMTFVGNDTMNNSQNSNIEYVTIVGKDGSNDNQNSNVEYVTIVEKLPKNFNHEALSYHPAFSRNRNKRIKKSNKLHRSSRTPTTSSTSSTSHISGTRISTFYDDTPETIVRCFQDERGNMVTYTFDCLASRTTYFSTDLPDDSSQCSSDNNRDKPNDSNDNNNDDNDNNNNNNNNYNDYNNGGNSSKTSKTCSNSANTNLNFGNNSNSDNSTKVPPVAQQSNVHDAVLRQREPNVSKYGSHRSTEEPSRLQMLQMELKFFDPFIRNTESYKMLQKFNEPWDSNINPVSYSNSENESSISLNSTNASPTVDMQKSTFGLPNERIIISNSSQGNSSNNNVNSNNNNNNNNNNFTTLEADAASILLAMSALRSNDSNNNNNIINAIRGRSHFYVESSYHILSETYRGNNLERSVLHSPTAIPEFRLLNAMDEGNEEENGNYFRSFDMDLESSVIDKKKQRRYYKLYYTPLNFIKIRFDRLELIALLDRNLTIFEAVLSLILSVAVSICGITILNYGFYRDLVALLFCFTMAGCQYSLLKSVQPDATSPTHGYNRVVIYSRSIYFCMASLLIMLLTSSLDKHDGQPFNFYSIQITDNQLFKVLRDGLLHILLLFPMLFTLGVFPQINTFSLYVLEQLDIHILGGHAMSNLVGAIYCILRSIATIFLIYGFAYGALSEAKASQHILFSIFCSLLIALSYHLSRSSSNPNIVWEILKNHLFQDELIRKNYSNQSNCRDGKCNRKKDMNRSEEESVKGDKSIRNDGDDKSDDKNSQNNLLLNSNPSSNETLKTIDTHVKSNFSENLDNSGNASEIYNAKKETEKDFIDPLPEKLKNTVNERLKNDAIVCCFVAATVCGLHSSTVFTALQPDLNPILWGITGCSGIVLHYIVPQLRKQLPWLCVARPFLRSHEHDQFEVRDAAKVMWFEETYLILCFLEKNLLYPVLVLATLTHDGPRICHDFGIPFGALITTICGLKMMRTAFSNTSEQYLIVIFTALLFEFDYQHYRKSFLVDYFFLGIVFSKTHEFLLKMQFVVTYIAPWQITWGSTFHAFAQLFSVPHSALLIFQAAISALLSAPLNPFLGSALFFASYARPIKFWERDYNTKRVDHSNTRLSSHLERNLGSDDNNLNSIFYEHLTRSLQNNLCGDLELGRWGPVCQGDCFILASDYLNCLVHIIEMGNGLVTFQMRGLEFRGTFCQQREVEAISEGVEENDGCCCCQPGHLPNILSVNAAFSQRWLAWEVISTKYVLEGYSISDNSAKSMLQVFDFRKVLVTYYVKSIIFYCIRSSKLYDWLNNSTILAALQPLSDKSFVDLDPVFNINIDQDFDLRAEGITRNSFCHVYLEWIQYCASKREKPIEKSKDSPLISLCLALSLMGRRTLGTASHNTVSNVEFFLYGLHALFKGDFRITSVRDEWIFTDMELLKKVVAPGVRMSLKLHQDHFMSPEEYEHPDALYDAISDHEENLVISHEGDPTWRSAVLSGTPSLLALRHVLDDGGDEYKIIMLNKRFLSFRVIKLNKECVRGLWAGQQQELVFFRNRNPERGSIQNAKQVLRNIINSSCDQPIGYPIYVSPLTTSYSDTNKQFTSTIGGPLSLQGLKTTILKFWGRIRQRCREGCSSGSGGNIDEGGFTFAHDGTHASGNTNISIGYGHNTSGSQSIDSSQMQLGGSNRGGSLGRSSLAGRSSLPSVGKPSSATLASLAELSKGENVLRERETSFTFIKERSMREDKDTSKKPEDMRKADDLKVKFDDRERKKEEGESRKEKEKKYEHSDDAKEKEQIYPRVRIIDPNQVYDAINLGRRIDVLWPDEAMRARGGRSHWKDWLPDTGMEGQVVHCWIPNHRDPSKRSHVDKIILLVKIDDRYVPIAETGVLDLGAEV